MPPGVVLAALVCVTAVHHTGGKSAAAGEERVVGGNALGCTRELIGRRKSRGKK